jgi:hypothetical protein
MFERQRERGVVCLASVTQFQFCHKHEMKTELQTHDDLPLPIYIGTGCYKRGAASGNKK